MCGMVLMSVTSSTEITYVYYGNFVTLRSIRPHDRFVAGWSTHDLPPKYAVVAHVGYWHTGQLSAQHRLMR